MSETKVNIEAEVLVGVLRQKLNDRDYENALLTARNISLEKQLKEVLEGRLQEVEGEIKKTETELKTLTEGGKTDGN